MSLKDCIETMALEIESRIRRNSLKSRISRCERVLGRPSPVPYTKPDPEIHRVVTFPPPPLAPGLEPDPIDVLKETFGEFDYLGRGNGRAVFLYDDQTVFKVSLNEEGAQSNCVEHERGYVEIGTPRRSRFARCWTGIVGDIQVLFMERVSLVHTKKLPKWSKDVSVDNAQVGYTADGVLVQFDYG